MKLIAILALAAAGVLVAVQRGTQLPGEVQPIAWNAEPCAHCRMLIGEPAYAAQVITSDGDVRSFDDPGCAARFLREHRGGIHRAWFHAGRGDAWIALDDVGFLPVAHSPMGSNVMAVPRTTAGARRLEDVR